VAAPVELLERQAELDAIESALAAAVDGGGRIVLIEGEAGAGKSSLLAEARRRADERGCLTLSAAGSQYERDFSYGVIRQLAEPLVADEGLRASLLGEARIPPIFLASPPSEVPNPFAIQNELYWVIADVAGNCPLALIVDDLHWADPASALALAFAGRRIADLAVLLVLALRPGEHGEEVEAIRALQREPDAIRLEPAPLSEEGTAELIAGVDPEAGSTDLAAAYRKASGGNPLLLRELLRSVKPSELGEGEVSAERLSQLAAGGVSRSVLERIGSLGGEAREVADAVALLEPNATVARVSALSGVPADDVVALADRLLDAHVLADGRPLGFAHPLIRAAVLDRISVARLGAMHAQVARMLDSDGAPLDAVAAHLLLVEPAGEQWVAERLRDAAASAVSRGAPESAVAYLRRALDEPPADDRRLAVTRALGSALLVASDPTGNDVLIGVRDEIGEPDERAAIAMEAVMSLTVRGDCDRAATLLEESLDELGDDHPQATRIHAMLLLLSMFGLEGVAERPLEDAAAVSPQTSGGRMLLQNSGLLAITGFGTIDSAVALARAGVDCGEEDLEADALIGGLFPHTAALTLVFADHGDEAPPLVEIGIRASRRRGTPAVAGYGVRALCKLADGDLTGAIADAEIAIPVMADLGIAVAVHTYGATWVTALIEAGELDRAQDVLDRQVDRVDPVPGFPQAISRCARGQLAAALGHHEDAVAEFEEAGRRVAWIPAVNPEVVPWRPGLARALQPGGDVAGARQVATDAVVRARELGSDRAIGVALATRAHVEEGEAAIAAAEESIGLLTGTRARLQLAHVLADHGAMLRRANRRKEAREPLRKALELAHDCGARPLEERARTELAATGARPRSAVLSGVASLTPSELRVAELAADGMTNREIAQELFVSRKTVETHLRHCFQKLEISGRGELAGRLGLDRRSGEL